MGRPGPSRHAAAVDGNGADPDRVFRNDSTWRVLGNRRPGVPVPVFLGGARVHAQYAFGPTIGSAVNVTPLTYVDTCALGVNVDTTAIPDCDVFHEALVAGFDELLALAG